MLEPGRNSQLAISAGFEHCVATGFILCFSEHFLCSPRIGQEPQYAEKPPVPLITEQEVLGVCSANALLARNIIVNSKEMFVSRT